MKYRKLRIAWSVAWGIACMLLIALWLRSYWCTDVAWRLEGNLYIHLVSNRGTADLTLGSVNWMPASAQGQWWRNVMASQASLSFPHPNGARRFRAPHWLLLFATAALTAVPWLPWRFSLRTLLIGMTVAAIGLGWLVYAFKK